MKSSEKEFTPQDSLQIIRSMIESTRHSLYDSSPYFLLWGWAVMIACLTQFFMLLFNYPNHSIAWLIVIPVTGVVFVTTDPLPAVASMYPSVTETLATPV